MKATAFLFVVSLATTFTDHSPRADSPPGITGRLWFYNNTRVTVRVRVSGGGKVLPVDFDLKPGGTWKVSTVETPPAFTIGFEAPGHNPGRVGVGDGRGDHVAVFRDTPAGAFELFVFRPNPTKPARSPNGR